MPAVPTLDAKPLYALAGAGEAAVTALRARVISLPESVKTLQTTVQAQVQSQVQTLPSLVQTVPAQVKDLRAQVRKQVIDLATKAEQVYDEFAAQGEKVVAARRGAQETKPAAKPATKPAAKKTTKPTAKSTTSTNGAAAAAVPAPATSTETTPAAETSTDGNA